TVAMTGSYTDLSDTPVFDSTNWNTAYAWGNHDTVGYITEEADPQWLSDSSNYYTKSMLADAGQSQVHYDNLTNVPTDLSDFTDNDSLLFDGNWNSLDGTPPGLTLNDTETETALELSLDGGSVLLRDLNYWSKDGDEIYYEAGNVGVGLDEPVSELHIHSDEVLPDDPISDEFEEISMKNGDADDKGSIIGRTKSTASIQVTNEKTGKTVDDGLLIKMHNKNANIINRDGSLSLRNNGSLTLRLDPNDNLSITGGNLAMYYNEIRFRSSNDAGTRINYTNNNGLDGLHIQGRVGVEIATQIDGTVMTVKDGNVGIGTNSPENRLHVERGISATDVHDYDAYTAFIKNGGGKGAGLLIRAGSNYDDGYPLLVQNNSGADDDKDILAVSSRGNVGIGTAYPNQNYKLDVAGKIRGCKVYANNFDDWCDHVFEEDHALMPLDSLESFVKENKHLPGIPTEAEVLENGLDLGDMNKKLLEKVEELSLYIIAQEKRIKNLEKQLKQ
ncbi:MAG: hypothetical protein R6V32_04635, partial [Bacteroidales bacterium]